MVVETINPRSELLSPIKVSLVQGNQPTELYLENNMGDTIELDSKQISELIHIFRANGFIDPKY